MRNTDFIKELIQFKAQARFIDKPAAEALIEGIFRFLFSREEAEWQEAAALARQTELQQELCRLLSKTATDLETAALQSETFFEALPGIYRQLLKDAEAILNFDPAAQNLAEIIISYPGFYATAIYRLSHQLAQQQVPLLPRLFTEYAHGRTGIDIHPSAVIGESFAIDHGTGIVVGETARIGSNVKLYQSVTLGALNVAKSYAAFKRHPTIEDDVVIYAGATILGGDTIIGRGSIIGGNVWITHSIPSNSVVYHKSEIHIKDRNPFPEPLNFII
ncbi:MAG TPA: serine acetyltransferase [Flavisolibacter sp.]|jgi:serine O-acetyltransferase|nr:serine acetyltransferase [Flavisolibacter sp.]